MVTKREDLRRGLDRRAVLRAAGLGLAGGAIAVGTAGLIASLGSHSRVLGRTLQEHELRALVERSGVSDGPIPEYRKRASLVVLPRETATVNVAGGRSVHVDNSAGLDDLTALLPAKAWLLPALCLWNQDPFTAVVRDGGLRCVLPNVTPRYSPNADFETVSSYLRFFLGDIEITRAPFAFEGGNLRFDVAASERLAFGDFEGVDQATVCRIFRVDRAVDLGCRISLRGTGLHLDEFVIFLGDHRAGVVQLTAPDDGTESAALQALEAHLERVRGVLGDVLGYAIVDLPCARADFVASRTYANCLQYTDCGGHRHILVPDYGPLQNQQALARTLDAYRTSGAIVDQVRIATAAFSGGLHCLTNMIL
jgi:hypothetical protein